MGNESSKEHSRELSRMSAVIRQYPKLITKGIKTTIEIIEDQVAIRFVDLKDTAALEAKVADLFQKSSSAVVQNYVVDTATKMYKALSTTKEMKDIKRSYHRQKSMSINNKIYGLEVLYCIRGTDQSSYKSPDSIKLLIAYKVVLYIMEGGATDCPDKSELQHLEIL